MAHQRPGPLRLVLDTNIWLDWLVFDDDGVAPIKSAVAFARAEIFIDDACTQELARVLAYPRKQQLLAADAQAACLAEYRSVTRWVEAPAQGHDEALAQAGLPVCRDPDDQKFLALALASDANFLITKDKLLLELARRKVRRAPFLIVTPGQFKAALAQASPREPR